MKKIMISIITTTMLFAFNVEVKKAPVKLLINEQETELKVDDKLTLNAGDIICFVEGDGRVVIRGKVYKKQISKRSKSCKHLPSEDGQPSTYVQAIENSVVSLFKKSKEQSVDGVSRNNSESDTLTAPIAMAPDTKYLSVENTTWGPLPVTLELLNENNTVVETMINEEDILTSFILPRHMLKEEYSIKVFNAFGDLLVNSKIHF